LGFTEASFVTTALPPGSLPWHPFPTLLGTSHSYLQLPRTAPFPEARCGFLRDGQAKQAGSSLPRNGEVLGRDSGVGAKKELWVGRSNWLVGTKLPFGITKCLELAGC
jgi:hypothetical protein